MPCPSNCFSLDFYLGGFKNKSDVCHILCEELFIYITHSQVHVETRAVELESRSRKDFQPEESEPELHKILTTPTPGRPFAHQL